MIEGYHYGPRNKYTPRQTGALRTVAKLAGQLQEVEELQEIICMPKIDVWGCLQWTDAELALDSYLSFGVLEAKLKRAVARAKKAGIGREPFVGKVEKLVFDE